MPMYISSLGFCPLIKPQMAAADLMLELIAQQVLALVPSIQSPALFYLICVVFSEFVLF